ncbi:MAG: MFS family permease [Halieaceae bacterium]|jgi:MFS family permease
MVYLNQSASTEWRRFGTLPVAAALGYATSVIHIYGIGPYIEPIQEAFGWSRAQATSGLTIATIINAIFCILIGMLVDRIGPRVVGLIGVLLTTGAFALLGTATGEKTNWYLLWGMMAFATLPVQATIWTSAVASRFETSRGMALAVTLSGASLAATVFPLLATWLIDSYGWRTAFAVEGGIWAAITFPMLFLFFQGPRNKKSTDDGTAATSPSQIVGVSASEALRSLVFARLFVASVLFTFTIIALVVHFIPILTNAGADRLAAAGVASLVGISSLFGRLGTGYILDHFRASRVGAVIFLLPIIACLLLMLAGANPLAQSAAAIVIGLTLGSEIDVIVYLTTKHFGLRNFGTIYGGLLTALSIGTAFGPLAAAAVYDHSGSYAPFLALTIVFMAGSSLALASLPHPPQTNTALQ